MSFAPSTGSATGAQFLTGDIPFLSLIFKEGAKVLKIAIFAPLQPTGIH
jgi:hypothetical protein